MIKDKYNIWEELSGYVYVIRREDNAPVEVDFFTRLNARLYPDHKQIIGEICDLLNKEAGKGEQEGGGRQEEPNKSLKRMGSLYDFVEKAIATWGEEKKENILIHLVCLWAVAAKAEDEGGRRHPLVERIRNMFRSYGLKTVAEIAELEEKLED